MASYRLARTETPDSKPCPVVTRPDPDSNCFELRNDELERLLTSEDVADLPVVVVSVAGGFRLGKSFLLGFFIRYLEHLETPSRTSNWMGADDVPMKGFSWKYGSVRETTGIVLWGKVFKVNMQGHRPVAVVLMDTEGSFDNTSTIEGNVTIFSMSMLLSSIQVYNLTKQITQSDLEHLKLFAEYASMARSDGCQSKEAFQKLLFLVRDWQYSDEKPFGLEGGQSLLDPWLEKNPKLAPEVSELRENIRRSFKEFKCFLMPRPGDKVETKKFNGSLYDISVEFKHHLQDLVHYLLSPEMLVPKELNGNIILCKDLVCMFQTYFSVFKEQQLPQPMAVFNATAFVHNKALIEDIVKAYETAMGKIANTIPATDDDGEIEMEHQRQMRECLSQFEKKPKMGTKVGELREQLIKEVKTRYKILKDSRQTVRVLQRQMDERRAKDLEETRRVFREKMNQEVNARNEDRKRSEERMRELQREMEERHAKDLEETQRAFKEKMNQMSKEQEAKNEEAIANMARIHELNIELNQRKAMAHQSANNPDWGDVALSAIPIVGPLLFGIKSLFR